VRKLFAILVLFLLSTRAGLALSGSVGPALLKAEADSRGEISIRPVDRPLPTAGTEVPLRLHFEIKNLTKRALHLPVIEMRVFGADGVLRSYFGIQFTDSLAATESRRFFFHTDVIRVRQDDRVVLVPIRPEQEQTKKPGAAPKTDILHKVQNPVVNPAVALREE
jgi:hypothetical protein